MINKPDIVLYHADCMDGFGAAYAAWHKWGDTVEYRAVKYGQKAPEYADKKILILDFSFSRAELANMAHSGCRVQILDHHKTAQEALRNQAEIGEDEYSIQAYFDMERSGARLAWDFIHATEVPKLILLIEDRDLWRFEYPASRPFSIWLKTHPFDFTVWADIDARMRDDPTQVMTEALAVQRYVDQRIEELLKRTQWRYVDGHHVLSINCEPAMTSDVCAEMLKRWPNTPFVMAYSDHEKGRSYSLRSTDDRMDVSVIAQKYGGGGHRNAAGFGGPS